MDTSGTEIATEKQTAIANHVPVVNNVDVSGSVDVKYVDDDVDIDDVVVSGDARVCVNGVNNVDTAIVVDDVAGTDDVPDITRYIDDQDAVVVVDNVDEYVDAVDVGEEAVTTEDKLKTQGEHNASDVNTQLTSDPELGKQEPVSEEASPKSAHEPLSVSVTSYNESENCTDMDALLSNHPNTGQELNSVSDNFHILVPPPEQSLSVLSDMAATLANTKTSSKRNPFFRCFKPSTESPDVDMDRPKVLNGIMSSNLSGDGRSTASEQTARVHYLSETSSQLSLPRKENLLGERHGTLDSEFSAIIRPSRDSGLGHYGNDLSPTVTDDVFLLDSPPPTPLLKHASPQQSHLIHESLLDSFFVNLSALYAMLISILGAVIPVSEPFSKEKRPYLFQGFYIYLYGTSVVFLLFMYICVLRQNGSCPWEKKRNRNSLNRKTTGVNFTFDDSPHSHTGSFYLRLGAVAFGVGSMIKSGLNFGNYFEANINQSCDDVIYGIRPIIHLIFTFGQLYFVFLHSKVCVHRYKILSRFGFMHMVATNICVWLGNIVEETLFEIHENKIREKEEYELAHQANKSLHGIVESSTDMNGSTENGYAPLLDHPDCHSTSRMRSVAQESGPYLYPCSIEYSLICAGVLYIMWKNIGRKGISFDQGEAKAKAQRMNLDCSGSSRGLFLGILVLVAVVITVITFFVLVRSEGGNEAAVMLEHFFEIVIYIITSLTVIMAFYKMQSLRFTPGKGMDLEQNLIVLALAGIYIFSLLSIIAGAFIPVKTQSLLIIISSVLRMFQATIQTAFMLNSLRRNANVRDHEKQKPGREFVTFLLMVNIGMWIINTFEVQQSEANPVQIVFYGLLPWNIFTHLSSPLAIFYRFHSTVCLSNIWKHAWKRKRF